MSARRVAIVLQERAIACLFALYLGFVFIGSRPYQNLLIADSSGETDALRQLAVLGVGALGLVVFFLERARGRSSLVALIGVLAFTGFLLASATWSENPGFVVRRAGVVFIVSLALCVLVDYLRRAGLLMSTLIAVLAGVLAIDVLSMLLLYGVSIDHDGRWKGIHIHKNVAGGIMALSAITFFWVGLTRRIWLLAAAVAVAFLVMTASKTSFALLFGSVLMVSAVLAVRALRRVGGLNAVLLGFVPVLAFVSLVDPAALINRALELSYGDVTLTGRVFIWDYVLAKHDEAPWLGHGFGSFWGMGDVTPAISEDVPLVRDFAQGHNGYLDVLVQTGWVGMALFGAPLLAILSLGVYRVVMAERDWHRTALALNVIFFVMLHNLLESTWLSVLSVEWTLFFIAALGLGIGASSRSMRSVSPGAGIAVERHDGACSPRRARGRGR